LYNDILMKDLGVVRKVPIQWEEYIPVFDAVLPLKRTQFVGSGSQSVHDGL